MKILKSQLQKIIKEEYERIVAEAEFKSPVEVPPEDELKDITPYSYGVFASEPVKWEDKQWKTGEEFRNRTYMMDARAFNPMGDVGIFKIKGMDKPFIAHLRKAEYQYLELYDPKQQKDMRVPPTDVEWVKPEYKKPKLR